MGSAEGARKARAYLLEQYGSMENYKEAMRKLGAKGGAKSSSRPFQDIKKASEAGKKGALKRWAAVEIERRKGGAEQ